MGVELKQLQQAFKQHLFSGNEGIADMIVSDSIGSDVRLAIYANAYATRLIEALENDYPVLKNLMGESAFYDLCEAYIKQFPSTYPSLRWFGKNLAGFLVQNESYGNKPYMQELASFEWALVDAFNAADADGISESDVAQVAPQHWPQLSFTFHPAVRWLGYQWNIIPIWQADKEGEKLPEPRFLEAQSTCLIWRSDLKTLFRTLDEDEAAILPAAYHGADFSQICQQLEQWTVDPQQIPLRAASLLKTWIGGGLITQLKF